jgi:hypothetical protein
LYSRTHNNDTLNNLFPTQLSPQLEPQPPSLLSGTLQNHILSTPTMLRQSLVRSSRAASRAIIRSTQQRQAHAISNPTLANIEKRWEGMPPQEQADLWMALRDRMKANWAELTLQEKKAGLSPLLTFLSGTQTTPPLYGLQPCRPHNVPISPEAIAHSSPHLPNPSQPPIPKTQANAIFPNSILHRLRRPRTPCSPSSR